MLRSARYSYDRPCDIRIVKTTLTIRGISRNLSLQRNSVVVNAATEYLICHMGYPALTPYFKAASANPSIMVPVQILYSKSCM